MSAITNLLRFARNECRANLAFAVIAQGGGDTETFSVPPVGSAGTLSGEALAEVVQQALLDPEFGHVGVFVRSVQLTTAMTLAVAPVPGLGARGMVGVVGEEAPGFDQGQLELLDRLAERISRHVQALHALGALRPGAGDGDGIPSEPVTSRQNGGLAAHDPGSWISARSGGWSSRAHDWETGPLAPPGMAESRGGPAPGGPEPAAPPEAAAPPVPAAPPEAAASPEPSGHPSPDAPPPADPRSIGPPPPARRPFAIAATEVPEPEDGGSGSRAVEPFAAASWWAATDAVTGLPSLGKFFSRAGRLLGSEARASGAIALVLVEVPEERTAAPAARALAAQLRFNDPLARIDRDLFAAGVLLFPGSTRGDAVEERLGAAVRSVLDWLAPVRTTHVLAEPGDRRDVDELLRQAMTGLPGRSLG